MPLLPSSDGQSSVSSARSRHFSLAKSSPDSEGNWISHQVRWMAAAWARGDHVTAEDVLAEHPELDPEDSIRLVYEEVCLRRDAGQEVYTAEVVNRFPQWRDAL